MRIILDAQIERIVIVKRGFCVFIPFIRQALLDEWLILVGRLIRESLAPCIDAEADDFRAFGDEILIKYLNGTVRARARYTED